MVGIFHAPVDRRRCGLNDDQELAALAADEPEEVHLVSDLGFGDRRFRRLIWRAPLPARRYCLIQKPDLFIERDAAFGLCRRRSIQNLTQGVAGLHHGHEPLHHQAEHIVREARHDLLSLSKSRHIA